MDKRAGELNAEYLAKAKHTDHTYCGTPRDTVGLVELKLGSLGRVHGSGSLCPCAAKQSFSCERLNFLGPGAAAAALRRNNALHLERRWAQQRRADALSTLQGRSILRRGHFKMD